MEAERSEKVLPRTSKRASVLLSFRVSNQTASKSFCVPALCPGLASFASRLCCGSRDEGVALI